MVPWAVTSSRPTAEAEVLLLAPADAHPLQAEFPRGYSAGQQFREDQGWHSSLLGTDVGSRRWDGEAEPSLFDWDAGVPEHTAVGSSPPPGLRCTEPGQCHSPHAAESCGSQWHSEFLLSPSKIWGSPPAPQGTAPAARWVSSQPPSQATATGQGLSKRWGRRE